MAESKAHKGRKQTEARGGGAVEVTVPGVGRIDAITKRGVPVEIERSDDQAKIAANIAKLNELGGGILKVPHPNLPIAKRVTKQKAKVPITVSNLGGTQKTRIKPKP